MMTAVKKDVECSAQSSCDDSSYYFELDSDCATAQTHSLSKHEAVPQRVQFECIERRESEAPARKRKRRTLDLNFIDGVDINQGTGFLLAPYDARLALHHSLGGQSVHSLAHLFSVLANQKPVWRADDGTGRCICRRCSECESRMQDENLMLSLLAVRVDSLLGDHRTQRSALLSVMTRIVQFPSTSMSYARGCICLDGSQLVDVPKLASGAAIDLFIYWLCLKPSAIDEDENEMPKKLWEKFARRYTLRSQCKTEHCVRPQHQQLTLLKTQPYPDRFVLLMPSVGKSEHALPVVDTSRCDKCDRLFNADVDRCGCLHRFLQPTNSLFDRGTIEALFAAEKYIAKHHKAAFGTEFKFMH